MTTDPTWAALAAANVHKPPPGARTAEGTDANKAFRLDLALNAIDRYIASEREMARWKSGPGTVHNVHERSRRAEADRNRGPRPETEDFANALASDAGLAKLSDMIDFLEAGQRRLCASCT